MAAQTTLITITGLAFPNARSDKCIKDRNALEKLLRDEYPSIHCIRLRWQQADFDLSGLATENLMLVGHSFGGDTCLTLIDRFPGVTIDSLVLLDPVPNDHRPHASRDRRNPKFKFAIPTNVKRCVAYRRTFFPDLITHPKFVEAELGRVEQREIDARHADFWTNRETQSEIRSELTRLTRLPIINETSIPKRRTSSGAKAKKLKPKRPKSKRIKSKRLGTGLRKRRDRSSKNPKDGHDLASAKSARSIIPTSPSKDISVPISCSSSQR